MQDHLISITLDDEQPVVDYADIFNVSVMFVDRHLDEGRAGKTVIHTVGGDDVTYGELYKNVNRAGNVLKSSGLRFGDRMLMMVKDSPEFYYLFWGAIKSGIIPVPINTLLRTKDFTFMIEDSVCRAVVYSPEFAGEVEPALAASTNSPDVTFLTTGNDKAFDVQMLFASDELKASRSSSNDDCFWLYSSGTTGTPKGTVHLHKDMVETSFHYAENTLGLCENDICFSAAKLFFAYGLGNAMTFPLWVGATAVLLPGPPSPDCTFDAIEKYKPTVFFGVPTLYAAQLKSLGQNMRDLSSLKYCVSAGEALPADIFNRWEKMTGTKILDGIGSTEALHIFISNLLHDVCPGTSGRIVEGYEARIIGDDGQEVNVGDSGCLMIKGASNAKYYWNSPEKTAATMVDGWLNTGDTYFRDDQGYYHYCGRNDDMLKVGGIWCSPFEIEAKLIEHEKVLEAAVVGRADDADLIKPQAYIVLNNKSDAGDALAQELLQHCKSGLAKYKYPRWFEFVDDLPKTATGKIKRFVLRNN